MLYLTALYAVNYTGLNEPSMNNGAASQWTPIPQGAINRSGFKLKVLK